MVPVGVIGIGAMGHNGTDWKPDSRRCSRRARRGRWTAPGALTYASKLLQHRAGVGAGDHALIPLEPAGKLAVRRRPEGLPAPVQFRGVEFDVEGTGGDVDFDGIAVLNQADGPARGGFRADVADAVAARAAREPAVGDQADLAAQAHAHDGRRGREHLLHAGTALGAFIANHHHMPFLDLAVEDARHRVFFAVEADGGAGVLEDVGRHARRLDDRAVRGDVAEQHRQPARFRVGRVEAADDLGVLRGGAGDVLAEGLLRDRGAVKMENAVLLREFREDGGDAARAVHVFHMDFVRGRDLADVRDTGGDVVEALQRILDIAFARDGEGVEHGVGGAAHGHVERERVVDGLRGDDVARFDVGFHEFDDLAAGRAHEFAALVRGGEIGAVSGQGHAQGFAQGSSSSWR